MTHEHALDLVVDSLVGALDDAQAQSLDQHLRSCTDCRREAAEIQELWEDLGALPSPAPDPALGVQLGRRLATRPLSRWHRVLRVAAILLLLAIGVVAGQLIPLGRGGSGPTAPDGAETFLLLIRGTEPERRFGAARIVDDYRNWAIALRETGQLVEAEKLTDDPGRWIAPSAPGRENVSGYFVVRAADYADAERIARNSPHVQYGGAIEVRAIDR